MEKKQIAGDIVFFALSRWNGPYSSTAISIAKEFSKTNRIIYIDSPFSFKDILSGFFKKEISSNLVTLLFGINRYRNVKKFSNIIHVVSPLIIPINFLPKGKIYNFLSNLNEKKLNNFLKKTAGKLSIKKFVFINCFNPFYFSQVECIDAELKIYYCFDNISKSPYISKHGTAKEVELIKSYDITLTTSEKLLEHAGEYTSNSYCLPNAADYQLFQQKPGERPSEYPQKIILGYIGNLDHRIDLNLLKHIAENHPDKALVLIGPITDKSIYQVLKKHSNVLFLGKKQLDELPNYTKHFSCGLIPFKVNELTSCIYPLKINEYLACGIPVITTGFSNDVKKFKSIVAIENNYILFSDSINELITENTANKVKERIHVSSKNSWGHRVSELKKLIKLHHTNSI